MTIIICDRCGKKMTEEERDRHSMTISKKAREGSNILVMHCDKLNLMSRGALKTNYEIDLCSSCKKSFVEWFGKAGFYERE